MDLSDQHTKELVVNESYWKLGTMGIFKKQNFLAESFMDLNESTLKIHSSLAVFMKEKDTNNNALYGVEIKTNGSSRSARIPLVRISDKSCSIWKIVKTIKDVDKGIVVLNELIYHLRNTNPTGELPKKVLLVLEGESQYINDPELSEFIEHKVEENKILFISKDFMQSMLKKEYIDFNKILAEESAILTQNPIK